MSGPNPLMESTDSMIIIHAAYCLERIWAINSYT